MHCSTAVTPSMRFVLFDVDWIASGSTPLTRYYTWQKVIGFPVFVSSLRTFPTKRSHTLTHPLTTLLNCSTMMNPQARKVYHDYNQAVILFSAIIFFLKQLWLVLYWLVMEIPLLSGSVSITITKELCKACVQAVLHLIDQ